LANWPARIVLGAISSTYSTLISRIAAARIGRDAAVEWMSVAAIPARDRVLQGRTVKNDDRNRNSVSSMRKVFPGRVILRRMRPLDHVVGHQASSARSLFPGQS
jgi:hypothetical protein